MQASAILGSQFRNPLALTRPADISVAAASARLRSTILHHNGQALFGFRH
jgi:hypothetical protein